jgi:hypothetical protein
MSDEKPENNDLMNALLRDAAAGIAPSRARRQALEARLRGQSTEPESTEHDNVQNEEETESGYGQDG